jgi:hypothetical protein
MRSSPAENSMLAVLAESGEPCLEVESSRLSRVYQLYLGPTGPVLLIGFGDVERTRVEACAQATAERLLRGRSAGKVTVKRDGLLSVLHTGAGPDMFLAFPAGRLLWSPDRQSIEDYLAGPRLSGDSPLAALLGELEGDGVRTASSDDYTVTQTGVQSRGYTMSITKSPGGGVTSTAIVYFADKAAASEFLRVAEQMRASPSTPEVGKLLTALNPQGSGATVIVNLLAAFELRSDPAISHWLQEQDAKRVQAGTNAAPLGPGSDR